MTTETGSKTLVRQGFLPPEKTGLNDTFPRSLSSGPSATKRGPTVDFRCRVQGSSFGHSIIHALSIETFEFKYITRNIKNLHLQTCYSARTSLMHNISADA